MTVGNVGRETPSGADSLRANSLGLWHLLVLGLAYMSLAPVMYFNMGLIESLTGAIMPFVFLVVTLVAIPTAISYAIMSSRAPSAGSAYTWLWESTAPSVGLWLGWIMLAAYTLVTATYPAVFGLFFNAFLGYFGVETGYATGALGGLLLVGVGAIMARNNARVSMNIIGILLVFEAGFVALLSLFIVFRQGLEGNLTAAPFDPSTATNGAAGIFAASVFGILAISGFDAVAPAAEESRTPSRLVPLATILVTLIAGAYYVLVSYGFAISVPVERVVALVEAGEVTPVYPIAEQYVGALGILVPITGFTAAVASFGACLVAVSRLFYSLARQGFAPPRFARLHPRHQTPWNSEALFLVIAAVLPIAVGVWQGQNISGASAWLGQAFIFFLMIPYILVNVANILYHLRRGRFNWLTNGLVPVLGIAINAYVLYRVFFRELLGQPFTSGSSIVWFCAAWAILGVAWVGIVRRRSGSRSDEGALEPGQEPLRPTLRGE